VTSASELRITLRGKATVAIWLAAVAAALVVAWRTHYIADLSAM